MKRSFLLLLAVLLLLPAGVSARKKTADVKVISYNIRLGIAKDGDNAWEFRYPASAMMIPDQKPDIFGLQEAFDFQVKYLEESCGDYRSVGVGREDGKTKGEFMSIFYNRKTTKLLKWGTFWLSETPEVPSKGWDADCIRTATWALLKDRASGRKYYYVNTHLDHKGWEARRNGMKLIVERIDSINPKGLAVIVTGDFNMRISRPEFDDMKKMMKNAREEAVRTDHHQTYNGWGKGDPESIIDYIWYKGFSACPVYETITKPYMERKYISDHYPITATLVF